MAKSKERFGCLVRVTRDIHVKNYLIHRVFNISESFTLARFWWSMSVSCLATSSGSKSFKLSNLFLFFFIVALQWTLNTKIHKFGTRDLRHHWNWLRTILVVHHGLLEMISDETTKRLCIGSRWEIFSEILERFHEGRVIEEWLYVNFNPFFKYVYDPMRCHSRVKIRKTLPKVNDLSYFLVGKCLWCFVT